MKVLLVEPDFPIPTKSKNHHNFLPIGLLKLASYHRGKGNEIKLVRGNLDVKGFRPDKILVTSIFTYWSEYVRESVQHYRSKFPKARIVVGGIYASLMPDHCKEYTGCDDVFVGVHEGAESLPPAYDLVDVNYQIIHSSRGCTRKCRFCGVWKIEEKFEPKKSILQEICRPKLVFYDNNMLANPHIKDILSEIVEYRLNGKRLVCESQSGFDGRKMTGKIARLLKQARFVNPRIAWDNEYSDRDRISRQVNMLADAGYPRKDIYVFVLYNWNHDFETVEKKRIQCWEWGVQISDCRFRPLDQTFDHYNPRRKQTSEDYYIHNRWTDEEVKQFRKNVRRQNICVRHEIPFHSKILERKAIPQEKARRLRNQSKEEVKRVLSDAWFPGDFSPPAFRIGRLEEF